MSRLDTQNRKRWHQLILDQKKSEISVAQFCLQNNLKPHQFSYFKSVLFPKNSKKSSFVEVLKTNSNEVVEESRIILYFKELSLSFEGNHDPQNITKLCILLSAQE